MRLLLQRVASASVLVEDKIVGQIGRGILVLAGFRKDDKRESLKKLADKCINLRIFEDEESRMNLSLLDIKGELLVISQFTLYANCHKGRRPSFDRSMPPDEANRFYELLIEEFARSGLVVETGIFGAKMQIKLINDGPVTISLDDDEI